MPRPNESFCLAWSIGSTQPQSACSGKTSVSRRPEQDTAGSEEGGGRHHPNLAQLGLPQGLHESAQVARLGGQQQRMQDALASGCIHKQHLGLREDADACLRVHDGDRVISVGHTLDVCRNELFCTRSRVSFLSDCLRDRPRIDSLWGTCVPRGDEQRAEHTLSGYACGTRGAPDEEQPAVMVTCRQRRRAQHALWLLSHRGGAGWSFLLSVQNYSSRGEPKR